MLTTRIGPLDLSQIKKNDLVERRYYDKFVEDENGVKYKGEW